MPEVVAYLNEAYWATEDAFGTAKAGGFRAVEIPEMFHPAPEDEAGQETLRASVEALGLSVIWHTAPAHNRHFGSGDAVLRQANIERTAWELSFVHRMGWDTFVIHPGKAETEADKARAHEALECLSEQAGELGIQLALENASGPFDGDPGELARICQRVPGMRLTYDCSHAFRSEFCRGGQGDLLEHLAIVRPFVHSIQFNDYDGSTNCEVGKGVLPWGELMPIALEMGCETWTIELHGIEETVASKVYLEQWLNGEGNMPA
jgi:sugar phosphate isomerase/epimerase